MGSSAGYVILQVVSAKPGEAVPPAQREAQAKAITQQAGAAAEFTYAEALKARHNVKILRPELQRPSVKGDDEKSKPAVPPRPRLLRQSAPKTGK